MKLRWWLWCTGWVELASGLTTILTLGMWVPAWSLRVQGWMLDKIEETEKGS